MSFLLKIVEGPNKGAEIALVDGIAVSLGKSDSCDIVLADPTLPDSPLELEANAGGATIDGEPLEPFHVKTFGATSLAVGPAGEPWSDLVWPKEEEESPETPEATDNPEKPDGPRKPESQEKPGKPDNPEKPASSEKPRRRLGSIIVAAVLLVLLLLLLDRCARMTRESSGTGETGGSSEASEAEEATLSAIAGRYGLVLTEGEDGAVTLYGNLATRAERLQATAEIYQAQPGANLDLSDDESFRTAAEDALFTLTEGALTAVVATNRFLHIAGSAESPLALRQTIESLSADLPKLRGVSCEDVKLASATYPMPPSSGSAVSTLKRQAQSASPALPVCGILTKPYPCLVMRDGRRILEGASLGDSVVLKIESDSVTLTNSMGKIVWKP